MDILKIPFVEFIGIKRVGNNLSLEFSNNLKNHIGTIHASAIFALTETQSGLYLQELYPQYENSIIPLLRSSSFKFKNATTKNITAIAWIDESIKSKFIKNLNTKGKAIVKVFVEINDSDKRIVAIGEFDWFISKKS